MVLSASPYSLYIHIPFCHVRCSYCAFNTYIDREHLIDEYVDALTWEIAAISGTAGRLPVHTVYFGGGTPSMLDAGQIARTLQAVHNQFDVDSALEVSLEANPGTLDLPILRGFKAAGITRLSLGMQSANQSELAMFGRLHDLGGVQAAVLMARQAGFDNLSLDLIYGVPKQSREMWRTSLAEALALEPEHLSLYALSLESGTELFRKVKYAELPSPDADLAADMYEDATEALAKAGFEQYEISNWSLPQKSCRHNRQYWRNLPYLGLGAGAHGYAGQTRTVNVMRPEQYIERLKSSQQGDFAFPCTAATMKNEAIAREVDMAETIFLGLRLLDEGLSLGAFAERYGERVEDLFADELDKLTRQGLLALEGDVLKLTPQARLISNYVFQHFLAYET